MASLATHLVIAQEYCERNEGVNFLEFLRGSLQPDLVKDKKISHYSKDIPNANFREYLENKVDLAAYIKDCNLLDDCAMGEFLHILTDYIICTYISKTEGFEKSGVNSLSLPDALKATYAEFDKQNGVLLKKYKFSLEQLPEFARGVSDEAPQWLNEQQLVELIDYCAKLDLKKEYERIKAGDFIFDILDKVSN